MLKSRDGCGEDMGRKGANGGVKVGLCNASKLKWGNGGRWGERTNGNE
ncbi:MULTISPECIES: hypothetical protein [unclassified Bartonella]